MFDAGFSQSEFQYLINLSQEQMLLGLKVLDKKVVSNDES